MADIGSEMVNEKSRHHKENSTIIPYTWNHIWKSVIWNHLILMVLLNAGFAESLTMYTFNIYLDPLKPLTIIWIFIVGFGSMFGTTAGAHRLWTHRSYKANLPLRILLMLLYSTMGMYSLQSWIKDHRVHHKYSETDADPHNAKRGFVFSHIGWICIERQPECLRRGREIDIRDIKADGVVMFQTEYKTLMTGLFCFVLPTLVPILFWEESILNAVLSQCFIRYVFWLHLTFSVNSFAHLFGDRPYNKFINPAENPIVSLVTNGEGSHNYHHTFPWDYKTSELPFKNFNSTTLFIQAMAKIGWAYDLREPSVEHIQKVIQRVGYKSEVKDHSL